MLLVPMVLLSIPVQCFSEDPIARQLNTLPIRLVWREFPFFAVK